MALAGIILYPFIVKFISKRSLYLINITLAAVLNIWLGKIFMSSSIFVTYCTVYSCVHQTFAGLYGFYYLPPNSKSYEHASVLYAGEDTSYTPFVLIMVFRFVSAFILITPNLYGSELFPLKSRCIAAGIATATTCVCISVATKTFYNFEYWLDMSTTFCIYGVIGFIGWL